MLHKDSGGFLPPFNKSPQAPSIASFKPSLNKNPSYFSIVRSPDIALEKKKLKDENWRLKQLLHSLNEENLKLKQKLSQRSDSRGNLIENSNISNQSRFIDILQETLKNLRNDLNKKKQENADLKKKIMREDLSSSSKFNRPSRENRVPSEMNNEKYEKTVLEFNKNLNHLQNEIKAVQEEKQNLENAYLILQERVRVFESKKELKVEKLDSIFILKPVLVFAIPKRLNSSRTMRIDSERALKRENLKNTEANVFRFFRTFFMELHSKNLSIENISNFLERRDRVISLDLFLEVLNNFGLRLNPVEIEETYNYISQGQPIDRDELIRTIEHYSNELDSSKSSDISSGSDSSEVMKITINKTVDRGVNTVFDNLSMTLLNQKIDRNEVIQICQEKLPENINFDRLLKFFTEDFALIKDKSDQTFVAINFMEGFELKGKSEIIEKCLNNFFTVPEGFILDTQKNQEILSKIKEHKESLLEKFKEYDSLNLNTLSWEVLFEILKNTGLLSEESLDFKYFCFSLGKNLKKIPYSDLLGCGNQDLY